ncbi:MAG: DUF4058 family protein, partial [Armatimonadetes bacterium]|nr:DUF4058 family protein [Anaerolineae bacterium]
MPIHLKHNPYKGINAHLHSDFQHTDGWGGFHSAQIIDLMRALDRKLPAGYIVDNEQSMQIRDYHPDSGEALKPDARSNIKPDTVIVQAYPGMAGGGSALAEAIDTPTRTLTATATADYDDQRLYLRAVAIRVLEPDLRFGRVVTLIELLSPSNKPGGSGFWQYAEKRILTLQAGIVLVELDYLHETPSPVPYIPSYPAHDPAAYPYSILVTDPRPTLAQGKAQFYGIRVDQVLPRVAIPLGTGDAAIAFDFNAAYQQTFTSASVYGLRADYAQLPAHFEAYDAIDQARIQALMQTVANPDP